MKYLAILFICVASLWTTAGALSPGTPLSASLADRALAGMVAAALIGLQLRRRQKSLHMPRPLY